MRETRDGGELVDFALGMMRNEKARPADRLAAHAWLSYRALGKALQPTELLATFHTANDNERDWSALPLDERRALLERLRSVPPLAQPSEDT